MIGKNKLETKITFLQNIDRNFIVEVLSSEIVTSITGMQHGKGMISEQGWQRLEFYKQHFPDQTLSALICLIKIPRLEEIKDDDLKQKYGIIMKYLKMIIIF